MKDKLDAMLENYGASHRPGKSVQEKILKKIQYDQWREITFIAPMKLMREALCESMKYVGKYR